MASGLRDKSLETFALKQHWTNDDERRNFEPWSRDKLSSPFSKLPYHANERIFSHDRFNVHLNPSIQRVFSRTRLELRSAAIVASM
ncbi:hypothetical protein TNCV_5056901 [Trichonephila clavipes]|nr:hypothetical protein TNCV_5056901 [Trichonephila clavipes]